jgi:uncharacterized membrane protein
VNPAIVVVGVGFGLVYLILGISQGSVAGGLGGLAVMLVVTTALVVGARFSDTIALLGDDVHEERHVHIHQRAALYTGNIVAFVIVIAGIVDFAQGGNGTPYTWLAAVMAFTYVGSVLIVGKRS